MIVDALREIGGFIDKAIYWFVELLLQLILDLANTQIFSQSVITEFANRIYIILGLVMLFKIIISFIQILINPDKMDDKEQGVGNILMRVVISLLLIVLVPSIFSLARQLQSYIIPIIPKVVLGTEAGSTDGDMMNTSGRAMAFYSYTAFFTYNTGCVDGSIYGTGNNDPTVVTVYDVGTAVEHITDKCAESSDGYRYKYDWPMSMIVGIYLVFMLVQIAVAVAIRAIKLGICEFIAPIPIASYIDPKTSKQAFDNWVSTSIKTYLDLFTRLIVVYFVVFVFMIIVADETFDTILASVGGDTTRQALVVIAIIIGLLQFAKQAPKFISDMLGVKEGMGDIGGMFKGEGLKGIAGALGTVGAAVGSGIGNARYAWQNRDKNHNIRSLFSAGARGLAGAGAATVRGGLAVANGKGWRAAFSDNIATTTGNSHRRVNKGAIVRQSRDEYNVALKNIDNEIASSQGNIRALNLRKESYNDALGEVHANMERVRSNIDSIDNEIRNANQQGDTVAVAKLSAFKKSEEDKYSNLVKLRDNLSTQLAKVDSEISSENDKITSLQSSKSNVPRPISPHRNAISGALDRFTGMSSVSGSSLLEASSALSSMRSSYYTGEAMKKLSEEGSKLKEKLSMGATYSEVASAYEALRTGQASEVTIGGVKYNQSNSQQLGEVFKKAEKEAAIKYINAVSEGKIKNETISEGFKQVYGILDGLGVDSSMKQELIKQLNDNPGEFFKSLSDISKRLETEGKRRQAYEREQKKNN